MGLRNAMTTILDEKDARIAALESALKLAKEALECPSCDPSDSRVCRALAAIKEARND